MKEISRMKVHGLKDFRDRFGDWHPFGQAEAGRHNSLQSPYWAMKTFAVLDLEQDAPFRSCEAAIFVSDWSPVA